MHAYGWIALGLASFASLSAAASQPRPLTITHMGFLIGEGDRPVDGHVELRVSLHDTPAGGSVLWRSGGEVEAGCLVAVKRGYYAVSLGASDEPGGTDGRCGSGLTTAHVPANGPAWLQVQVGSVVLEPRQVMNPAPVAATSQDTIALTAQLASPAGTINAVGNPVHWNQLVGVPAGIADGIDSDTVPVYTAAAGGGLALADFAFSLAAGGVGTRELADGSITREKLTPGVVGTDELAGGAVTAEKIATGAVGTQQLADQAVTAAKLAPGAVGTQQLADQAVSASKLAPASVGTQQLAGGSVTLAKLGINAGELPGSLLVAKSVTGAQLADGAVTAAKLAAGLIVPNADLLDGLNSDQFLRRDIGGTVNGAVTLAAGLTVSGGGVSANTLSTGTLSASGAVLLTGGAGSGYETAPLEIRTSVAPRVSFHQPGVAAAQLGLDSAGRIRTYNQQGNGYAAFWSGSITAHGSLAVMDGDLSFSKANPVISAPSYLRILGGAYFESGTVYVQTALQARGGLANDDANPLVLHGGGGGITQVQGPMTVGACPAPFDNRTATVNASIGGITRSNTICATDRQAVTTFMNAQRICFAFGGHVMTQTEAYMLMHYGYGGVASNVIAYGDWLGTRTGDDGALFVNNVNNDNMDGSADMKNLRSYRCVMNTTTMQ